MRFTRQQRRKKLLQLLNNIIFTSPRSRLVYEVFRPSIKLHFYTVFNPSIVADEPSVWDIISHNHGLIIRHYIILAKRIFHTSRFETYKPHATKNRRSYERAGANCRLVGNAPDPSRRAYFRQCAPITGQRDPVLNDVYETWIVLLMLRHRLLNWKFQ